MQVSSGRAVMHIFLRANRRGVPTCHQGWREYVFYQGLGRGTAPQLVKQVESHRNLTSPVGLYTERQDQIL